MRLFIEKRWNGSQLKKADLNTNRSIFPKAVSTVLIPIQTNTLVASFILIGLRMQHYLLCHFPQETHCSNEWQSIFSIEMELHVVIFYQENMLII
jgi:hypothetical protein